MVYHIDCFCKENVYLVSTKRRDMALLLIPGKAAGAGRVMQGRADCFLPAGFVSQQENIHKSSAACIGGCAARGTVPAE